jgi:hypothetical protein
MVRGRNGTPSLAVPSSLSIGNSDLVPGNAQSPSPIQSSQLPTELATRNGCLARRLTLLICGLFHQRLNLATHVQCTRKASTSRLLVCQYVDSRLIGLQVPWLELLLCETDGPAGTCLRILGPRHPQEGQAPS